MNRGPVVVVGAGLAGLACAQRLQSAGIEVVVLEAADAVGGRVRSDVVDGFRCDRGFQLLNPAYPVLPGVLGPVGGVAALELRAFAAGVVVIGDGRRSVLADPRRVPRALPASVVARVGTPLDKLRFAGWAATTLMPVRRQLRAPDRTLAEELDAAALTGPLRTGVVEPFLAGVLADWEQQTSARFARLLVRSFVLGSPSVPSLGMGRLSELVAASLRPGTVRLDTAVLTVAVDRVTTEDEEIAATAVVVATDPHTAARLTDIPEPPTRALTTFWFTAPEPPSRTPMLHLDGDRSGPVVNTAVMTAVAPTYAPAGRPLVAATLVGADGSAATERAVRQQAGRLYGVATDHWETVTTHVVAQALPAQPPGRSIRLPSELPSGVLVAGDHRDTASIQGALVSGRRAADRLVARFGETAPAG